MFFQHFQPCFILCVDSVLLYCLQKAIKLTYQSISRTAKMAERPTPHSVAVCTLIALLSEPSSPLLRGDHDENGLLGRRSDEEGVEAALRSLLLRPPTPPPALFHRDGDGDGGSNPGGDEDDRAGRYGYDRGGYGSLLYSARLGSDPPLSNLLRSLPPHAARAFLDDLRHSSESVDSLHDLFDALRASLAPKEGSKGAASAAPGSSGSIDPESLQGQYLRRRCLGFDRLGFEAASRLWGALRDYVEEGRRELEGSGGVVVLGGRI